MKSLSKWITISLITIVAFSINMPLLPGVQAQSNQADPIRLAINPTEDPNQDKVHLSYEIKPTKSIEDVLTLRNYSTDQTYTLKLYPVDAIQGTDGASAFKLQDKEQVHIGTWITLNNEEILIEPGETKYIPYRIDIPENSTPGTFQGGLIAEMYDKNLPNSEKQIKIVTRFIEPIFVSIPGRKKIEYNLETFSYNHNNGKPEFQIKFSNSGNVFLKGEIDIAVEGTLLSTPYQATLNQPSILQHETLEKKFSYEKAPLFGQYKAKITFHVLEYDVINDELRLVDTIEKEISFSIIPYFYILGILFLIALAIFSLQWYKVFHKYQQENTFEHKVKKGETIISIAKQYKVKWKKIAHLNKLKSPYTISTGDVILLPFPKTQKHKIKHRRSVDKKGK